MACMEHQCVSCDTTIFNNLGGPSSCPKCGDRMIHHFDEPIEREEPDRECDEPEDDEE